MPAGIGGRTMGWRRTYERSWKSRPLGRRYARNEEGFSPRGRRPPGLKASCTASNAALKGRSSTVGAKCDKPQRFARRCNGAGVGGRMMGSRGTYERSWKSRPSGRRYARNEEGFSPRGRRPPGLKASCTASNAALKGRSSTVGAKCDKPQRFARRCNGAGVGGRMMGSRGTYERPWKSRPSGRRPTQNRRRL